MKLNNINYVKLHGNFNNCEKNIIIYYDDVLNINNFIKYNDNYNDLFFEIDRDETLYSEIEKLFKNDNKIRVHWNNVLSNNFIIKSIKYEIYNYLNFNINLIKNTINENKLSIINGFDYKLSVFNNFLNNMLQIKNNINIFFNILKNNYDNKENENKNNIYSYTFNFIKKLKNRYDNINISTNINKYFIIVEQYIYIIQKNIDYIINKTRLYINLYNDKLNYKINIYPFYDNLPQLIFKLIIKLTKIYKTLNIINDIFNDIYTMRRILDKKYISNCIIYSKSDILYNYIFSLINIFNFKITEISSSNLNIDNINNKIKNIIFDIKYQYNTSKILTFS